MAIYDSITGSLVRSPVELVMPELGASRVVYGHTNRALGAVAVAEGGRAKYAALARAAMPCAFAPSRVLGLQQQL